MSADADSFGFFFTSAGAVTATAIVLFCTVMSFFYSLMEYSAKFVGDLKHSSEEDETKREKAVKIRENSEKYQERARTGFLMNFALVMIFSSVGYIPFVKGLFSSAGDVCSGIVSFVAVILPMLIVSEIFGRFLPEKIAFLDAENILAKYSVFFMIISAFAVPMTFICSAVSGGIAKIFGHGSGADNKDKTEEKILMMVDEGEENGSIEENTKSMIENVFDFDDTTVGEIMTHRKDVVAVEDNAKITELTKTAIKSGCSRIPVYHGDIDNIVGIIYVKDLAQAVMDALEAGPMRKAYFISENQSYTQQQFRKIVLDELGKKVVIPVTCPLWVVKIVCHVAEFIGKLTGKPSTLNPDKFRILKQRNWQCDTSDAQRDFKFSPQHSLKQGVHEAIEWYRQAGWL